MPNLRSYTREQLLALPPSAELDELVHGALGRMGHAPQYSKDVILVGVMLGKLREYWPFYRMSQSPEGTAIYGENNSVPAGKYLPHACALALVLAAWEKERE